MKKIEAIIRPETFETVRTQLADIGLEGMNTSTVEGFGRQKGHTEVYRGTEYLVESHTYLKFEIVVEDDYLEDCLSVITKAARTGKLGDGKIFVSDLEKVISIRTGEESITDVV